MSDPDTWTVVFCVLALAFGGFAKGVTSLGLPAIAVSLLSIVLPLEAVLPLLIVSFVASNVWQAATSPHLVTTAARFWPLLLVMLTSTFVSARLLAGVDANAVYVVVSIALILFVVSTPLQGRIRIPRRSERWTGPALGVVAGVIGGPSGIYGPTLGVYFDALRLQKDQFVAAIGLSMALNTSVIWIAMVVAGRFGWGDLGWSTAAVLPVAAGMALGTRVRGRIDQERFRLVLRVVLFLIALNLLRQALG